MNQIVAVNLIWSLFPFLGIIIGATFWLNHRRAHLATASIKPEERVPALMSDELIILDQDSNWHHLTANGTAAHCDEDAEPPSIGWFY